MNDHDISVNPLDPLESVFLKGIYRADKLIADWKTQFDIDITYELHGVEEIRLYEGKSSGLQFFAPDCIAGSSFLYEQLQKFDWFYMENKWEHREALVDLGICENVLEIGAATGGFVRAALNDGINIRGIEINRAAVETTRQEGLPIDCMDLETVVARQKESFDGVCSFQVLEHAVFPGDFIESTLQLLKPGGILILSVPNAASFLQYQYNLLDMPPHHMTRWRKKTFMALENIFPVKLEKMRFEPLASYHVSGYLEAYRNHFKKTSHPGKLLLNGTTLAFCEKLLSMILVRRFFIGQTLYVSLRKV